MSLLLADGYARWRGSLAPAVCAKRLASCLRQSCLPPAEFVPSWLPGVLTEKASPELVREFSAMMAGFHPPGFRAMARALAEADERDVLHRIDVPTLLLWGDADQRAPLAIGRDMHAAIPGSELAVVSGAGHASGFEQPEQLNAAVRLFLQRRAPRDG